MAFDAVRIIVLSFSFASVFFHFLLDFLSDLLVV